MQLVQKNILLAITGGIAAYKTPDLVRKLKAEGANVRVIVTESASHFVSSLSLQAVSGERVSTDLLDEDAELGMGHIELAKWADIMLIAPATANTIAKLAHGLADDLLGTVVLATTAPILVAPAMNQQMWLAQITQQNCQRLADLGMGLLGPAAGEQACGDVGYGRMLEPEELVTEVIQSSTQTDTPKILAGKQIVITAGPTREAIDPVRYISNHSSGKMGYALAQCAADMGATVTLVSGPVSIKAPNNCKVVKVDSAQQMLDSVLSDIDGADIFIACAAVADYRVDNVATQKMKKQNDDAMQLNLVQNPDILKTVASLPQPPFTLGFAAETQNVTSYARKKLTTKKLNMIAANDVSNPDLGFNSEENALIVLTREKELKLGKASKHLLSLELLKIMESEYRSQREFDKNKQELVK